MAIDELKILRKKADDLSSLIQISSIINSVLDPEEVVRLVMEKAQEVMNAEASSVFLLNTKTNRLEIQSALGEKDDAIIDTTEELKEKISLEIGQGIAGWVALHKNTLNIKDAQNDPRFFQKADKMTGFQTRSILAAPLLVKNKLIGVAEVINRKDRNPFDDEDVNLFSTFCSSVAMAIENTRLYKESIEQERFKQQLQSAKKIQQSFLPKSNPICPLNRFEISATYKPAKTIGGDFYDFIILDDDHIAIAFGDVSGKGIPAALYMARLLSDFHLYANVSISLEQAVFKLNDILVERSQQGMFVTFAGGILNAATGEFEYVNAGHLPILRIRKNYQVEKVCEASGIPLGIRKGTEYQKRFIQLDHNDYLIFLTDGVIEARNKQKTALSFDNFANFLSKSWESPQQIIHDVEKEIEMYTESANQHDDITLVVLKWC